MQFVLEYIQSMISTAIVITGLALCFDTVTWPRLIGLAAAAAFAVVGIN